MTFAVYYDTPSGRQRKSFEDKDEAIDWADKNIHHNPGVIQETVVYQPDPEAVQQRVGQVEALTTFLGVLDTWVNGGRANHEAQGHRDELKGDECWRRFHEDDIRTMVDHAAMELGIPNWKQLKLEGRLTGRKADET